MKRRQYLKALGATATALAVAPSSASASAYSAQKDYVTLTYDKSVLKEFRPLIVERNLDDRFEDLYGWVATSTERETNCCVFFGWREEQNGVSRFDSHHGDREPILVFYDPDTREVTDYAVDGYHYSRALYQPQQLDFYDGKHAKFHAVAPWTFYRTTTEEGVYIGLADLHDRYKPWLDNGWEIHRPAAVNPWVMLKRDHFWRDDAAGVSVNQLFWRAMFKAGLFGAGESDV